MANRILRDWTCSETINELSESAELFFTRLIMKADDFGRFYGSLKLLKAQLYPLKDIPLKSLEKWRNECVNSGIVLFYISDGKEYLEIRDFNQRLRIMKSKFPEPPTDVSQMTVNCQSNDGLKGSRKETESEVEVETESEKKDAYAVGLDFSRFDNQVIQFDWKDWKEYKHNQHKEKFKSLKTEQIAINKLGELCGFDAGKARLIIEQSIGNLWKGLFELKNNQQNGNGNTKNNTSGFNKPTMSDRMEKVRRERAEKRAGEVNMQGGGNDEFTDCTIID